MDKQTIRKMIKNEKRHFSQQELGEMSFRICNELLSHEKVRTSNVLLLYYPLPDEVDVSSVVKTLHSSGKTVLLPKVVSETEMTIHRYAGEDSLVIGSFGIKEPCGEEFTDIEDITLAIVPGMAFDSTGNRLGRGKGYYDRFLSRVREIYKIGVCYPFQMLDSVPCDKNDIRMDFVIDN